jgi:hypothetical protein
MPIANGDISVMHNSLSERELATILAALRSWQAGSIRSTSESLHFAHCDPLSAAEIDELCERLNCEPTSRRHELPRVFQVEVRKTEVTRLRAFLDITAKTPLEASLAAEVLMDENDESIPWTKIGTSNRGVRIERTTETR